SAAAQIAIASEQTVNTADGDMKKLLKEIENLKKTVKESQQQPTPSVHPEYNPQCTQPNHQQYAHNSTPMQTGPGTSPLIMQLQQQMAQTQLILQQHQAENARLYQELSDLDSSHETARFDQQRRDFESTLRLLTSKLQGQLPQNIVVDS
ncbi:hypothetical protein BVRB_035790, partial [Beta vulgaris subsp. vulgaris]